MILFLILILIQENVLLFEKFNKLSCRPSLNHGTLQLHNDDVDTYEVFIHNMMQDISLKKIAIATSDMCKLKCDPLPQTKSTSVHRSILCNYKSVMSCSASDTVSESLAV